MRKTIRYNERRDSEGRRHKIQDKEKREGSEREQEEGRERGKRRRQGGNKRRGKRGREKIKKGVIKKS